MFTGRVFIHTRVRRGHGVKTRTYTTYVFALKYILFIIHAETAPQAVLSYFSDASQKVKLKCKDGYIYIYL